MNGVRWFSIVVPQAVLDDLEERIDARVGRGR
jgi:hypothetical protein